MTIEDRSSYIHSFYVNDRVRFASEKPEHEPTGTIIETGYCGVKIQWDDEHPVSVVNGRDRLKLLEKV